MGFVLVSPWQEVRRVTYPSRCNVRQRTTQFKVCSFLPQQRILSSQTQKRPATRKTGVYGLGCILTGPDGGFLGVGTSEVLVILLFAWILLGPKGTYEAARNVGSFIANLRETANQAKDQFISALGEDYDGARREVEGIRDTLMGALSGETEDADEASDFVAENGEKQQKKSQREKNETVAGPRLDIPVSDRSEEDARAYFLDALQRVQDPNQVPPYMAAVGMSAERNHTTNGSIVSESDSIENDEFEASYIGFRRLQGLEERVATLEAAIAELKSLIETQHEQRVS